MINIRSLQLFYYVARHSGVSQAAKHMPYGIQQPALSEQMIELEQQLQAVLFQRRPFQLTASGQVLYAYLQPFFDGLDRVTDSLRNGAPDLIRMGASPVVLRDYLPDIFRSLQRRFSRLSFTLRDGLPPQLERLLGDQEIDLAVMVREGKPPPNCVAESLIQLPLVLLVHRDSPIQSAEELWREDRIAATLIAPSEGDVVTRHFRRGLAQRGVEWKVGLELSSFGVIETYARQGFGVGLSVGIPHRPRPEGLRELALDGFPSLDLAMIWHRPPNPAVLALMAELRKTAAELKRQPARSPDRSQRVDPGRPAPRRARALGRPPTPPRRSRLDA